MSDFALVSMFELWNYKIGLQELKVKRNEANEGYVRDVREKNDSRAPSRAWLLHTVQVKNIGLIFFNNTEI